MSDKAGGGHLPGSAELPNRLILLIDGMTCGTCVDRVERALASVEGVARARVHLVADTATVDLDDPPPLKRRLIEAVRGAGFDATPAHPAVSESTALDRTYAARIQRHKQALIQALGLTAPLVALHCLGPVLRGGDEGGAIWPIALEALLCTMLLVSPAGAPILAGGLRALAYRSTHRDALVSFGVLFLFVVDFWALVRGEAPPVQFHGVALILLVTNFGRYLELLVKRKVIVEFSALGRHFPSGTRGLHDRIACLAVPIVMALSLGTLIGTLMLTHGAWTPAVSRAVAVLVIASPAAIGLAVPAAMMATRMAAMYGVPVRDTAALGTAGGSGPVPLGESDSAATGPIGLGRSADVSGRLSPVTNGAADGIEKCREQPIDVGAPTATRRLGVKTEKTAGDSGSGGDFAAAARGARPMQSAGTAERRLATVRNRHECGRPGDDVGTRIHDRPALEAADSGVTLASVPCTKGSAPATAFPRDGIRSLPGIIHFARWGIRVGDRNLFWAYVFNLSAVLAAAAGWVVPSAAAALSAGSSVVVLWSSLQRRTLNLNALPCPSNQG